MDFGNMVLHVSLLLETSIAILALKLDLMISTLLKFDDDEKKSKF